MALRRLGSTLWRRDLRLCTALLGDLSATQIQTQGSGALWITLRGKKSYQKKLLDCFKKELAYEKDNYETDKMVKEKPPNDFELLPMEGTLIVLHKKHEKEDITIKASFVEQPLPERENPEDPQSPKDRKIALSNRRRPLFDHPILGKKRERNYTIVRDPMKANVKFVLPKWMVIGPEGKYHHTFGWTIDQEPPKDPFFDPPLLEVSQTIMLTVTIKKPELADQLLLECETDGGYMSINHVGLEKGSSPAGQGDYTGPAFGELDETLQDTFNSWTEERGIDDVLGDYLVQKIHDLEQTNYQQWLESIETFVAKE